jgi:putative transcription factor
MICDMCGSSGKLYKAIIEGAELTVCQNCSKFGKVISVVRQEIPKEIKATKKSKEQEPEIMEVVVNDYAEKIRKKRESLGLKQEEFAKKINEKESLVQKMESGHFEPSIGLAKKIQRFLRIRLIEERKDEYEKQKPVKTGAFTIGDLIKIKKK